MYTMTTTHTHAKADATYELVLDGQTQTQRDETAGSRTRSGMSGAMCRKNDIVFDVGDATSGTLTLLCRPVGLEASTTVPVRDSGGSAIVLTIGTDDLVVSNVIGSLESFSVTTGSVNGTGTMSCTISGGDS